MNAARAKYLMLKRLLCMFMVTGLSLVFCVPVDGANSVHWYVGNGNWDTTTQNWLVAAVLPGAFTNGDHSVFDYNQTAVINVTNDFTVSAMQIKAGNYLFTNGGITGVKSGNSDWNNGLLTVSGTNTVGRFACKLDFNEGFVIKDTATAILEQGSDVSSATTITVDTNAKLALNQAPNVGDTATFSNTFDGAGTVAKTGAGTVIYNGVSDSFTGTFSVEAGTLGGSGSMAQASLAVKSGAALAVGNSIGTMTVGSANFASGSFFDVEVGMLSGNPTESDLLIVNNAADLSGATVRHIGLGQNPADYAYTPGTWTILTAQTLNGTAFAGVQSNFNFLDAELDYTRGGATESVQLKIIRNNVNFAAFGQTRNQINTANGLQSIGSGDLYNAVLGSLRGTNMARFYDQLSGEMYASAAGSLQNYDRAFGKALRARVADKNRSFEGYPLWVTFDAYADTTDKTGNTAKSRFKGAGITLGAEAALTDSFLLGGAFRYGGNELKVDGRNSKADITSYNAALYAGWDVFKNANGILRATLGGAYGRHNVESSRNVDMLIPNQQLKADYDADTWQVFAEMSYRFNLAEYLKLEPFAGVSWNAVHTENFTEKGGNAALNADSHTNDNIASTLGLRMAWNPYGSDTFALKANISWQHIYNDRHPESEFAYAGGNKFTVYGAPISRDSASFGLGAELKLDDSWSLEGGYEGLLGDKYQSHGGYINVVFSF